MEVESIVVQRKLLIAIEQRFI